MMENKMITREKLINDYLDYVNNYLTIEKFAEHRGLHLNEAELLIKLAESCFTLNHPEA